MESSVIDFQQSIALVGGKEDLARKLLQMFVEELPEVHQDFHRAWKKKDLKSLREYIHKLYGACCYVSVPALMECLNKLRTAARAEEINKLINLLKQFDREVNAIYRVYKQLNLSEV